MTTEALESRGCGPFRQYLWTRRNEREQHWLERGRLVSVERLWMYDADWCVPGNVSIEVYWLLKQWYVTRPQLYYRLQRLLWNAGLIEPYEGMVFSWRRDFRPFPWLGRNRLRNRS